MDGGAEGRRADGHNLLWRWVQESFALIDASINKRTNNLNENKTASRNRNIVAEGL